MIVMQTVRISAMPPLMASLVFSNVFASVVSLLSDARIAAGLPSLKFLGPWLYAEGFKGRHAQLFGRLRDLPPSKFHVRT